MADSLRIAGFEQISNTLLQDLSIEQVLTSLVDSCSFTIKNFRPNEGDEVIVEIGDVRVFGGIIDTVRLNRTVGPLNLWNVECQDFTYQLNRRLVVETYEGKPADWIVKDIILKYGQGIFSSNHVCAGAPTVQSIVFDYMPPSECLKKLADYCGWEWYVDYYRDLWFFDPSNNDQVAPVFIDINSPIRNLKHNIDTQGLRNRVYVRGGTTLSDPFVYEITADGKATVWTLPHRPHNITMAISGIPKRIGIENVDEEAHVDFLVNFQEKYIKAAHQTATPVNGATLSFSYCYDIDVITMVDDFDSQMAIAQAQGGDGVYEHVIHEKSLTTIEAAEAAGLADLRQFANPRVRGSFETEIPDWVPGQLVTIQLPDKGISNTFLVQRVKISPLTPDTWTYSVEYGGRLIGIPDFLQALVSAQKTEGTETALLNKFVYGTEGLHVGDQMTRMTCQMPYEVEESREGVFTPILVGDGEDRPAIPTCGSCLIVFARNAWQPPSAKIKTSSDGMNYTPWQTIDMDSVMTVPYPGFIKLANVGADIQYYNFKKPFEETSNVCGEVVVS
ncbi:hypothetical protein H1S01_17715 [Heliobacterium chlorum]|uniref:Uncharacterized protein n=1 Tax=Heliobacterium chlorum TaxID=2698 RepID=A0ABR7T6A3_HELCL|nr:hypothetical protein [Heliobacterium chlorum]MBC9786299.1 hypothetical protein [Heliobacterium chlorum]